MKHSKQFSMAFLFLILLVSIVYAHLDGGQDVLIGDYTLDIGYDDTSLHSMRPTVFLISLLKSNDSIEVNTSSLWVKINDNSGNTIFSTHILPEPTGTYSFTTYFPSPGDYSSTFRFKSQENIEKTLPLNVSAPLKQFHISNLAMFIFGFIILFVIGIIFYKNKNGGKNENK